MNKLVYAVMNLDKLGLRFLYLVFGDMMPMRPAMRKLTSFGERDLLAIAPPLVAYWFSIDFLSRHMASL